MPNTLDTGVPTHEFGAATARSRSVGRSVFAVLSSTLGLLAIVALLGVAMAAAFTWSRGWPAIPVVHDEVSFVLAGDTFASGRLTNPTPPFPEHFETFHVLVRPSYASKYPPAQGLMLAFGQILTGEPIVGVWISTGILAAALTWMLLAWFPMRWALCGCALIMLTLTGGNSQDGYWLSTYWGGTVAATGAALVYGGVRRITQVPSRAAGATFALGLGILALSRPFEGAFVALPALIVAAMWWFRDTSTTVAWRARRVVAPFGVVMAVIAAFALTYNGRVTGHALRMPYAEYEAQYSHVPLFLFAGRSSQAVTQANDEMRRFYEYQDDARQQKSASLRSLANTELARAAEIKRFLAPGLVLILVVAAATSRRRQDLLMPLAGTLLVLAASLGVAWFFPHYIAPVVAPWAILLTAGAERLATLDQPPGRTGLLITGLILGVSAASTLATPLRLRDERPMRRSSWYAQRDSLNRSLSKTGMKHLVLVSYGPEHSPNEEWVHNESNLEESPVVWARALSPQKDARLIGHFRDRTAWRVQVDNSSGPFRLRALADTSHAHLANR